MSSQRRYLTFFAAAVFLSSLTTISFAQSRQTDALIAANFEEITAVMSQLKGDVSYYKQKQRILAGSAVTHQELMKAIQPIADAVSRLEGNQKQLFFDLLIALECRQAQDNCELRGRIEELERWRHEQEYGALEPTPTPIEVTPSEPLPEFPAPGYMPYPRVPSWRGPVDFITDRRDSFCPNAQLIARSIDCPFADGDIYHGDIFLTCQGRYVLLRHMWASRFQRYLIVW